MSKIKIKISRKKNIYTESGFTLIELLVVMGIISLIASVTLVSLVRAREKARIARTQADLVQIRRAIELLVQDTGKFPNGCKPESKESAELFLDTPMAGLLSAPDLSWAGASTNVYGGKFDPTFSPNTNTSCGWDASDVLNWKGPYLDHVKDAWGHAYFFDPDYGIVNTGAGQEVAAIISRGTAGVLYWPYSGTPASTPIFDPNPINPAFNPHGQASADSRDIYLVVGK